ncbi:hypothetical protein D9619_005338 [Psilocybe cf. subviscida]|uniref:Protein kinase domain-containing protein n=1 Tax=Psilocybe cf. subviscida TaxID=2480587 RepID=A0A8H5FAY7_9AGAR|nr:hypothetical protein D9619_005338 [Psilocybe cf. subviscida]
MWLCLLCPQAPPPSDDLNPMVASQTLESTQDTWSELITRCDPPFPRVLQDWKDYKAPFRQGMKHWEVLRPFFASKGYVMYQTMPDSGEQYWPSSSESPSLAPPSERTHPFARTLPYDTNCSFLIGSHCVWPARDSSGRDVVIKIISEFDNPSTEWMILQKLNDPHLLSNPRNRTIHVLEYITFDKFVFAVMPRWDCAFVPPFSSVSELMELAKSYLEALDFLHTHRIVHRDIGRANTGMNVYGPFERLDAELGLRKAGEVEYIIYDFGNSLLYPADTDISNVKTTMRLRYYHALPPVGAYNPFKSDVAMMGGLLMTSVMYCAKFVPEIESFLDHMMDEDEERRPTASEALKTFMDLYSSLTKEQVGAFFMNPSSYRQNKSNEAYQNQYSAHILPP